MVGRKDRTIIHLDLDAFYASVEQLDYPQLRGKPVVVGADPKTGRGVVSAASYEARTYGIHSAMPISQAYKLCPGAEFRPGRMKRYKEISDRIMTVVREYTPLVEQVSIDEAFMDVTGCERLFGSAEKIGRRIKDRILKEEGLTISVGIAPNKYVAKIASDIDKPDGFVIVGLGQEKEFLAGMPVERLWGVGAQTARKLRQSGIATVGQLAVYPQEALEKKLGKFGRQLWKLANGFDDSVVVPWDEVKSISNETTFIRDIDDVKQMKATLLHLTEKVGRRARKKGVKGKTIILKIRFDDFSTFTRNRTHAGSTDLGDQIYQIALELFETFDLEGRKVRLLGVGISQLDKGRSEQTELFERNDRNKKHVTAMVDRMKDKYGDDVITRAAVLKKGKRGAR
jgi:DNA polymerase-4